MTTARQTTTATRATSQLAVISRRGFSLLEITLVFVVIGLLMGVAALNLIGGRDRAARRTTMTSINTIKTAITEYKLNKSSLPPDLNTLITEKYLAEGGITDGWNQPIFYVAPSADGAREYDLRSSGADQEFGTEDDIDVWTMDVTGG